MPKEYSDFTKEFMEHVLPEYGHKTRMIFDFFLGEDYDPNELKINTAETIIRDTLMVMDNLHRETGESYDYEWFFEYVKLWLELPCDRERLERGYNGMVFDENGHRHKSAN